MAGDVEVVQKHELGKGGQCMVFLGELMAGAKWIGDKCFGKTYKAMDKCAIKSVYDDSPADTPQRLVWERQILQQAATLSSRLSHHSHQSLPHRLRHAFLPVLQIKDQCLPNLMQLLGYDSDTLRPKLYLPLMYSSVADCFSHSVKKRQYKISDPAVTERLVRAVRITNSNLH